MSAEEREAVNRHHRALTFLADAREADETEPSRETARALRDAEGQESRAIVARRLAENAAWRRRVES